MLSSLRDGHSIVLAGAWNTRIFSPQWVAANLSTAPEIGIAVAMNNPVLAIRLQFEGMYLHVGAERLVLSPVELTDQSLEAMQRVARLILERLPHTPMSAVGVNFQYLESDPNRPLLELFRLPDTDRLSDFGARVVTTSIQRVLRLRDKLLNMSVGLQENGSVTLDFNWHSDLTTTADAATHLDFGMLNYQRLVRELLTVIHISQADLSHA